MTDEQDQAPKPAETLPPAVSRPVRPKPTRREPLPSIAAPSFETPIFGPTVPLIQQPTQFEVVEPVFMPGPADFGQQIAARGGLTHDLEVRIKEITDR